MQEKFITLNENHILDTRADWKKKDKEIIAKAVNFSIQKHTGQLRKSGEPYVNHVIETGKNLSIMGMDTQTIVAGVLHDTLEDTETTEKEIEENFSDEILFLVKGVTKLGHLRYHGVERHVESLRKFFVAMAEDIRVVVIKLADRLHNIKTLEHVRPDKQHRIALETLEIHSRLADRLGMGVVKAQLEDYAFPYAFPDEYKKIKELIEEQIEKSEDKILDIKNNIQQSLEMENVKVKSIDFRVKHLYSLFLKLRRYGMDIENVHDILALRIIVNNVADCYKALGIIHSEFKPMPGRIKDYIAVPKKNGYKSLHTTIFTKDGNTAEIQIRTEQMHDEAEYGVASHLHYKEIGKNKSKTEIQKKTTWTKDLLELQKNISDRDEFMHTLKTDFFEDRIFVFTPKGDVIDLPRDASPIDFAFTIHSNIGEHMSQAKVNGKLVPFESKLQRGDMIEIVVSKNAKPSSKWLENVKTSIARKHIEKYLEQKQK
jgi:GTP diphosphokinase / guanosine-3',5'-bis(diphosphate) 3'-diphosphatase